MKSRLKLGLKQQIILLISLALLVPAIVITSISIYKINTKAKADIDQFRKEEMVKLKFYLKHITDIAYGMIDVRYNQLSDSLTSDSTMSTDKLKQYMTDQCLRELSKIRFDNGQGYFWVTDNKTPWPTMIMHAEKANLKGQVLNDPKYNVEKYEGKNIYQVRAERCNADGEAFVEYVMKKPGTDEVENKLSYSRLYKPLSWIVSTGFYTDQIDAEVEVKKAELTAQIKEVILYIVGVAIVILSIGLFISFHFSKQLTKAILTIKERLKELSKGWLVEKIESGRKDEVGEMTESLNSLVEGLRTYTSFAKEIGHGNLTQQFKPLSAEDVLGNELLSMRDNLKKAADDKNIRDWVNEGLAKLGDVLRRNNNDTKALSDEILKELVKYLKFNQGALFLISEDGSEKYLDLMSAYAYEKRKFINKRIPLGNGLAGQCAMERTTVHLREIPKDYINITSGLGNALPRTLLIVPLIQNEEVYGVIELASFKTLEQYEIKFIEKVAESIASTVSTVQVNERTRTLLQQSQQMSEELKAQEEELRQNQEELQATSEQMRRRQIELEEENKRLKAALNGHGSNGHGSNGFHNNGVNGKATHHETVENI
jgi:methyl-accepting chemotaxis protein